MREQRVIDLLPCFSNRVIRPDAGNILRGEDRRERERECRRYTRAVIVVVVTKENETNTMMRRMTIYRFSLQQQEAYTLLVSHASTRVIRIKEKGGKS